MYANIQSSMAKTQETGEIKVLIDSVSRSKSTAFTPHWSVIEYIPKF